MKLDVKDIKKLREETGAGVMETKQALEDAKGDYKVAHKELMKKVAEKASKKSERAIKDGLVYAYTHGNGRVGVLVHMGCETDFVAKNETFQELCKEFALQICAGDYETIEEVLKAESMRYDKPMEDLIQEAIAKTGENIELTAFKKLNVV
ncbi:translation elongation factor Ts [bacterium]|nr:translation elongation factor Ts [bacterium]